MRFAPSQHQSGLLSAFFGLHSIGLFSSAVAGLSAACAIVLPRLPVMRTDVVMAPRAFHPVSLSRLSLAPAAKPQPKPMLSNPSILFNRSLDFPDFLRTRGLCTAVAPWFRRRWFSNQGLVSSWSASFESASAYVFVVSMVTAWTSQFFQLQVLQRRHALLCVLLRSRRGRRLRSIQFAGFRVLWYLVGQGRQHALES